MKTVAVIPARCASSRFPGKPLADINGKPMIWWVYQEAKKVPSYERIIVATESELISDKCKELGMEVMLTSDTHPTGTDRVAEVAQSVLADVYVIVMGDEPLVTARDQLKLLSSIGADNSDIAAVMLTERFKNPVDAINTTTIKLAINDEGDLIFMSRSAIPFPKDMLEYPLFKNVGCYALRKDALDYFIKTSPGRIERAEGIELLRLIENHKRVKTVEIESESMAVDTKKDLERIRKIMKNKTVDKI